MSTDLLEKLANKTLTKDQMFEKVKKNNNLLPLIVDGMTSTKAAIRYGCGKVLMDFSEENPQKLYPFMDSFIRYLDSKYRIITWQTMFIIANLTSVDSDNKFDNVFDKYFSFINDEYMITVANVVGHSGKIALAKPYLIPKITRELLKVEDIKTTPHLSDECKKVIAESAVVSFDKFLEKIENKNEVISFVKKHADSRRKTLKSKAEQFLEKWDN